MAIGCDMVWQDENLVMFSLLNFPDCGGVVHEVGDEVSYQRQILLQISNS